jgi:hypothetical protein
MAGSRPLMADSRTHAHADADAEATNPSARVGVAVDGRRALAPLSCAGGSLEQCESLLSKVNNAVVRVTFAPRAVITGTCL